MITREEFLSDYKNQDLHRKYYAQFVTDDVKTKVINRIGMNNLLKCKDDFYFKSIPLKTWASIMLPKSSRMKVEETGETASRITEICILKKAAKQLVEITIR